MGHRLVARFVWNVLPACYGLAWIIHETGQILCIVQKLIDQLAIIARCGLETLSQEGLRVFVNNPG